MRHKKFFKIIVTILFVVLTFVSFTKVNGKYIYTGPVKSTPCTNSLKADKACDVQESTPSNPLKSGKTDYVPWEGDENFLASQAKNGTPVMMAAYRTVLKDPLPGEEENVHLAARLLAGTVVKPGEVLSQNQRVGPYTQSRGYKTGPTYAGSRVTTTIGGGVCKIASTLYNVTVLSDLPVLERYFHSMPVPYVPYGQDATVCYGVKDFKFKNNMDSPILIWAQGVDNILYIAFYGTSKPPEVEWHHDMIKIIKAEKIYRINRSLAPGTTKMVMEGMDGAIVKSWVTIKKDDGTTTEKQLGKSYYNPIPYIFEKDKN